MRRAAAATALAALLAVGAPVAAGDPEIAAVVIEPGPVGTRALVGASGELFRPDGVGVYRRQGLGGVAIDVELAVFAGGRLFAAGRRAPVFEFDGQVWRQHRLGENGRSRTSSGGGLPAIAIRRQIFVFDGGRWVRAAAARVWPHVIWVASPRRYFVADDGGGLLRVDGKRATAVRTGLAEGDRIVHFAGTPGRSLLAVSEAGVVLDVGSGGTARPIALPPGLESLAVSATCSQRDGTAVLVGVVEDAAASVRDAVVVAVKARSAAEIHRAPLTAGDRPAACASDAGGGLMWVSRAGQAWIRPAGGEWTARRAALTPPPAARPGPAPGKRPARSR